MKNKKLLFLSAVTLAVIIAASVVVNLRAPKTVIEKGLLFPVLAGQINAINKIQIKGHEETVTLLKKAGQWIVEESDGYPALFDKVRRTVISISELKVAATRTSSPALYPRLGVEGPEVAGSASVLVTLENNEGKEVAALIVGKQRHSKSADKNPGLYVRRPGDKPSLLVEGTLDITARMSDWFENTILDIPSSTIREIATRHADGNSVRITRDDRAQEDFRLEDIPQGQKVVTRIILNRMGTLLENMNVSRARAAGNFTFPEDRQVTTVRDFNGMGVTITSTEIDNIAYTRFHFDYDPDMAIAESAADVAGDGSAQEGATAEPVDFAAQVSRLNATLSDWVYTIPEFKYEILAKRMEDLVKPGSPDDPVNVNEEIKLFTPEIPSDQ